MKKQILSSILFLILLISGCGGSSPATGTITGTVSLPIQAAAIHSSSITSINNFPKVSVRRHHSSLRAIAVSNEKIIRFKDNLSSQEIANTIQTLGGKIKTKLYGTNNTYVISMSSPISALSLKSNANIIYAEDNQLFYAMDVVPDDPDYAAQQAWNYQMLNLPAAWSLQKGNRNVIVAVVDSGVSTTHPDLKNNLVAGWDFVDNDSQPSDTVYDNNPDDQYSHGTHVAGIISADTNNGIGVAGVAWNVRIMPVRVLGPDGSGDFATIVQGINWAVSHGANIINLSMGAEMTSADAPQSFKDALDNAFNKGVTVVAAAGNSDGPNNTGGPVNFPANYPSVIAVAALDETENLASYSDYGPEISVCAPGGTGDITIADPTGKMVFSTTYDKSAKKDTYCYMSGTSMAAPHIAGLAALLYSRGMTDPSAIRQQIQSHSNVVGSTLNMTGFGLPDAAAMLNATTQGLPALQVFYVSISGTNSNATSYVSPNSAGNYSMNKIPPGQVYIGAFLDKNANGLVDAGDEFGFYAKSVTIVAGTAVGNINISLSTVPPGVSNVSPSTYLKSLFPSN